ncbi:MAG: DUF2867 domain-containing protein [Saccharospirillaceae bacterium]|nr:DUF2867 domain-containing protein [Pseudomonadales bacterium]NRB77572.1 DUF2867 domain-containing protein [Saccharospirillaceae bacterium]
MDINHNSKISHYTTDAYFYDCHKRKIKLGDRTALDIYLELMQNTPNWINALMRFRNSIVSKLGLKDLGALSDVKDNKTDKQYKVGDQLGIFSIYALSDQEIILEDSDRHLTVKVSFFLCAASTTEPAADQSAGQSTGQENNTLLYTTTVVHVKNWFGKLYMFFVKPVHKIIVPTVLKKLRS